MDGNPHPRPPEQFHHPNQHNLFSVPVAFNPEIHLQQDQNHHNQEHDIEAHVEQVAEDEWDHWAMPPAQQNNVPAVQAGDLIALNDLMDPLENQIVDQVMEEGNSGITLSLGLPDISASSEEYVGGSNNEPLELLAPIVPPVLPIPQIGFDLNLPVQFDRPLEPLNAPNPSSTYPTSCV